MTYRPNLPAIGVAVPSLTVKTDSLGTDLLTINRAGVDYAETVATFVAANTTTIHSLTTVSSPDQADELAIYDVSGTLTGKLTITALAALVATINGTTPTYATTMTVSAPNTMTVGSASTVTVTGGSGGLDPAKTFTPSAPVAGTFSPTSRVGNSTTPLTFQFTPSAAGSGTFSATATGVTATPSGTVTISTTVTYATAFAVTAATSMTAGTASPVTVTPTSGSWNGQTVTPSAVTITGTFSPTSAVGSGTTPLVFQFTPAAAGTGTVTAASSPSLTATPSATITVAASGTYPSLTDTTTAAYSSTAKFGTNSRSAGNGTMGITGTSGLLGLGFWFKGGASTAGNGAQFIYLHNTTVDAYFGFGFSGSSLFGYDGGSVTISTNVRDSAWHYLYLTCGNNDYAKFYIDGTLVSTGQAYYTALGANYDFALLFSNLAAGDLIDEIVVYNPAASGTVVPSAAIARSSSTVPLALLHLDGNGTGS